jgi:DNA-binding CsgD family transcriptional regulator/tetratricopeptide (TPR) repeat protein
MAFARPAPTDHRSHQLVERDEPLAMLSRYLDEGAGAIGRIVLIRGEAGIGKTALLKAFVEDCPSDVNVFWGACDGVSTPQPYGPFDDMADALGPDFRRLLDSNASRGELGRWLLKWLAAGPLRVLVIEDIQWADQATLDLLAFLARRIESLPVLLLVSHRDGDGDAPSVARILGGVASLAVLRQLPLEPLSRAGVERLASDTGVNAQELHRITAGNPFYVHEVLKAGLSRIPISVRDAVRARVAGLDERGRRALQVAAILGIRAEPWLLAAVAGEDILGIDDCLRIGLLTKADGIAFAHELTRMVVLEDVPVIHGIALHRRALAALEQAGIGDAARLAYQAEGSADRDAVLRHASAAGHRALAAGANREAIAQFERALRFADGIDDATRADLLEPLSQAQHAISYLSEAYTTAAEAVAVRRRIGDARQTATALSFLAIAAWADGRAAEAWQAAQEARDLVEPLLGSRELGMAYATLGRLGSLDGRYTDAQATSERALEIGRNLDDREIMASALASIGTAALNMGEERGWADLHEALRIATDSDLPLIAARALNNLGVSALQWRRYDQAWDYFLQLEAHSSRSEIDQSNVNEPFAQISLLRGDWDSAESFARASLAAVRLELASQTNALTVLAVLAIRRGKDGWRGWLEASQRLSGTRPTGWSTRWPATWQIMAARAEEAWVSGDLAPVVPGLRAAYSAACREGRRAVIGELGIWLWRAGELSTLDERAEKGYALEVAGRAREAAAEWERLSMPYEAALSLVGSSDAADVQRAHEELTRLGATAVAHKVALRLRDLGRPVPRGPRPTTRANPRGLTEREWEIARLLALGLSNAEIADRLVVSPKTVGHHVSAVLAKLTVRRRAEVAAAMTEVGAPI